MIDELAAISCETQAMRTQRLQEFAHRFFAGDAIPWDRFLAIPHPLIGNRAIEAALRPLESSGRSTITFSIAPNSSIMRDVDVFYGQAGAFDEFVRTRSCRGVGAIGRLLLSYDPDRGFDAWLRANGPSLCLPASQAGFAAAFADFMQRHGRRDPTR